MTIFKSNFFVSLTDRMYFYLSHSLHYHASSVKFRKLAEQNNYSLQQKIFSYIVVPRATEKLHESEEFLPVEFPLPPGGWRNYRAESEAARIGTGSKIGLPPSPHFVARWSKTHTKIINYREKLEAERPVILHKGPTFYFHELLCFQAHF